MDTMHAHVVHLHTWRQNIKNKNKSYKLSLDPEETPDLVFLIRPSPVIRVIGQNAVLPCVASGLPTPAIRWMKNEEALDTER